MFFFVFVITLILAAFAVAPLFRARRKSVRREIDRKQFAQILRSALRRLKRRETTTPTTPTTPTAFSPSEELP